MAYLDFRRIKIARHLSLQLCCTLLDRTTGSPSGVKDLLAKLQTDRSLPNLSISSESNVSNIFRRSSVPSRGSYNWFTSRRKRPCKIATGQVFIESLQFSPYQNCQTPFASAPPIRVWPENICLAHADCIECRWWSRIQRSGCASGDVLVHGFGGLGRQGAKLVVSTFVLR